jgi:hypothetical protein
MGPYALAINAAARLATTLVSGDRIDEEKEAFAKTLAEVDKQKQELAKTLSKVDETKGKVVDKAGKIEGESLTVYDRGKGKNIQPLAKVQPGAETMAALEKIGKLADQDTTLETLSHHSAQGSLQSATPATIADVQKAMQAGGERLKQATRLGTNLHTHA